MKKIFSLALLVGISCNLLAVNKNYTIEFTNVNPYKFAIDSLIEDKFKNFSDTVFLIPNKIQLDNKVATKGYYFTLDKPINLKNAKFIGDVNMPQNNNYIFMTLNKMHIKDITGQKKILGIKEYLIKANQENGFTVYNLLGTEQNRYVSIKILVTKYESFNKYKYNICDVGAIEVTKLLNDDRFIFKTCKSYGKKVKNKLNMELKK